MYAIDRPRSAAFPSMSPYYWSYGCSKSADFANLFVFELVLVNMEIVKVSQLY